MGNDDPPEWWIMYFQVRDEVIFEVYIYVRTAERCYHIHERVFNSIELLRIAP